MFEHYLWGDFGNPVCGSVLPLEYMYPTKV